MTAVLRWIPHHPKNASDVDLTAMAVQALAPYYNSEETYEITRYKKQETKTVRQAVDAALTCLSESQRDDGGFVSWNMNNSESCCQVIVALCSLGIDPCGDSRFIKRREYGAGCPDGLSK